MTWLKVEFSQPQAGLRPGGTLEGEATWTLSEPAPSLTLRLAWTTEGQGADADPVLVETRTIEQPETEGRRPFSFTLPDGPWSFEGSLFSVLWYVELEEGPGRVERANFVLTPTGEPIRVRKEDGGTDSG
jgi:hypothetical protein